MRPTRQQGAVLVEVALVLPVLILAGLGGLVLGYMSYAKVALAMTVQQAARELAATAYARSVVGGEAYRFAGVVDTYGLPAPEVVAVVAELPVGKHPAVHVAACFWLPFSVPNLSPDGGNGTKLPPTNGSGDATLALPSEIRELLEDLDRQHRRVKGAIAEARETIADARSTLDDAVALGKEFGALLTSGPRQTFTPLQRVGDTGQLEAVTRAQCLNARGGEVLVVRASYLVEPPDRRKGG